LLAVLMEICELKTGVPLNPVLAAEKFMAASAAYAHEWRPAESGKSWLRL
jgi:hypothetical protein